VSIVVVTGDCVTTTTLALAAAWPARSDVLVLEADPAGGSMAAWLDVPVAPSLSTVVTRVDEHGWSGIDALSRVTPSGLRVIPAPVRSVEASRAVSESGTSVFPVLARVEQAVVLIDAGRPAPAAGLHGAIPYADVVVVTHRQARQSARAAAVRLERAVEVVDAVGAAGVSVIAAVIGSGPFGSDEVAAFMLENVTAAPVVDAVRLPEDPLAAAVLAGRTGVSARRMARLPLMRAAADAVPLLERALVGASHRHPRSSGE
jgi:MinD-like ATPase involved in chromosome partitioning or flagellar assembly